MSFKKEGPTQLISYFFKVFNFLNILIVSFLKLANNYKSSKKKSELPNFEIFALFKLFANLKRKQLK
jgi:hypothetical protein